MKFKFNKSIKDVIYIMFFLICFFSSYLAYLVADTTSETKSKYPPLQETISVLKKAIEQKDFSILRDDSPVESTVYYGLCSNRRVNLSVDEVIEKLLKISNNAEIIVNHKPIEILGITTIETKGWKGSYPYLYFNFDWVDSTWRWLGIINCPIRSNDFRDEQGEEFQYTHPLIPKANKKIDEETIQSLDLISNLEKAIKTRSFNILEVYLPDKRVYPWAPCGPGDFVEWLFFESINTRLLKYSKDAKIYIYPEHEIINPGFGMPLQASIETEGWNSEYPYLSFGFEFKKSESRWVFHGICDSLGPPPKISKEGTKYEEIYSRPPELPRPGPRIFNDYHALRARIAEILKFRAFDALKVYAIREKIIFGECNREMIVNDLAGGKEVHVEEVINFLKKSATGSQEFKPTSYHKTTYETTGWGGKYPFISFWFKEGKEGWKWYGLTYCKKQLLGVLYPDEPRFK